MDHLALLPIQMLSEIPKRYFPDMESVFLQAAQRCPLRGQETEHPFATFHSHVGWVPHITKLPGTLT